MRFLVIGLGSIGTRHAKNLVTMGHEVAGYDPDKNIEQGIIQDGWDGVVIASPTSTHKRYLDDAVDYGHNVLVEKPIAESSTGIQEILDSAKSRNIIVMVGNMLRFHPNVMMAKSLIKKPKSALFQVLQKNDKPAYRRDGVLLNWGAHEIDLALYLLGPAEVIGAKVREDFAAVTLEHKDGALSIITMDYLTEPEMRGFEITEKDGMTHEINLTLHDWNNIYIEEMKAFVGLIEAMAKPGEELNEAAVLRLATGLRWSKIAASGEDGLATLRLIEKAKEMAKLS